MAANEFAAVLDPDWLFLAAPRRDARDHVVPPTPAHAPTLRARHAAALTRYAAALQTQAPRTH